MLEPLFGMTNRERVPFYLLSRKEGYSWEIAIFSTTDLRSIQNQLEKLGHGGVLYSRIVGNIRFYVYPFLEQLQALHDKALIFCPDTEKERLMGKEGKCP